MALWKARGGSLNKELDLRSWHCGRQRGGSLNKEFDFRSWHCGRQGGGSLNKEGKGGKFSNLDHGIVEGKGGKFGRQGGEVQIKT